MNLSWLQDDDLSNVKIPDTCPRTGCKDQIQPGIVNDELRKLLKAYQKLTDNDEEFSMAWNDVVLDICSIIKHSIKTRRAVAISESRGWPTEIDFNTIPDRVVKLKEALRHLLFVEGLSSDNVVQRLFDEALLQDFPKGNGLRKMSCDKLAPETVVKYARAG